MLYAEISFRSSTVGASLTWPGKMQLQLAQASKSSLALCASYVYADDIFLLCVLRHFSIGGQSPEAGRVEGRA